MTVRFTLEDVDEVHLPRAPLDKVLTQVQFSRTPALVTDDAEAHLAELLGRYPVRRQAMSAQFAIVAGAGAPSMQASGQPVRIFSDAAGSWQVTITETSVAMETTSYDSRDDFCSRAGEVFGAVCQVAIPPVVDRVGLRYVDRLTGERLPRVSEFITPQLQVLHGSMGEGLALEHSVSDSLIRIAEDERLQVKSGLLPPGSGFDPALPPLNESTWVLDLDIYTVRAGFAFDPVQLEAKLRRYAQHVHAFFRFAVTPNFLEAFGGSAPVGG